MFTFFILDFMFCFFLFGCFVLFGCLFVLFSVFNFLLELKPFIMQYFVMWRKDKDLFSTLSYIAKTITQHSSFTQRDLKFLHLPLTPKLNARSSNYKNTNPHLLTAQSPEKNPNTSEAAQRRRRRLNNEWNLLCQDNRKMSIFQSVSTCSLMA